MYHVTYEPANAHLLRLQRKAERAEAQREARSAAAAAAKDRLQTIKANSSKRVCGSGKYGEFVLPPGVLQRVMSCLAGIEADGVRGLSMAANDLANAALVSWDFYSASKHGFATLEEQAADLQLLRRAAIEFWNKPAGVRCSEKTLAQLQRLPEADGWSWQQWSAFLQDPLRYKLPELKQAARQLRVPGSNSSKAELVVNLLGAFGLQQPSSVAPQLLRAVLLERCCSYPWAGCELVSSVWDALKAMGRDEVNRRWPGPSRKQSGLARWLFSCSMTMVTVTSAAARRRLLQQFTGACSRQQLLQLQVTAQQWQEQLSRMGEGARREALLEQQQEARDMLCCLAAKEGNARAH
ncbi:hypothetical protein OEZ86_005905 [Tetradesmus obliquus]|nr:hypothetical protein OEZ86_005905 [Tetradesmus obliquus]